MTNGIEDMVVHASPILKPAKGLRCAVEASDCVGDPHWVFVSPTGNGETELKPTCSPCFSWVLHDTYQTYRAVHLKRRAERN